MSYKKVTRRYRGKKGISHKIRPIKYASHLDANIYSYYALELSNLYEKRIFQLGLDDAVIGYRAGKGSNIYFANNAFTEIKRRKSCVAIAIDISDFFGSIEHDNLKIEWCKLLEKEKLPEDHFVIFKSLTKWASVDRDKFYNESKKDLSSLMKLVKNAREFRSLRDQDKKRSNDEKIFERNMKQHGIPQGSPISALLSNIFMLPFDKNLSEFAREIKGFYRRYSDDILFICDVSFKDCVLSKLDKELKKRGKELKRNCSKDLISIFNFDEERKKQTCDKEFQYLGFTFNGKAILLKSQTLARQHRRRKFAIKKAKNRASFSKKNGGLEKIFKKSLNRSFTPIGVGGFIGNGGYVQQAKKVMGSKHIKRQVGDPCKKLQKELI